MGNRDTEEMLEAARAECVRLERIIDKAYAYVEYPGNWSAIDPRRPILMHLLKPEPGGNQ